MKYTIQDLREGRVAVKNDGTLEELRKVIKSWFSSSHNVNIPTQSVKDFLEEEWEPKWGEEVEVSDSKGWGWVKRIFVGLNPSTNTDYKFIVADTIGLPTGWRYCRKIPTKTELTLKEIADKFKVRVENLRIKDK